MGCITSKAIARSMSVREDYFSNGLKSKDVAWEELLTTRGGNDQLFALVCSADSKTGTLKTSNFSLPSKNPETFIETESSACTRDLNHPILDTKNENDIQSASDDFGNLDYSKFTRSKSWQQESEGLDENKLDWTDKNLTGSRSFHTVEEYDALLERIHKSGTRQRESFEDKNISSVVSDEDQKDSCTQRTDEDSVNKEAGPREDLDLELRWSGSIRDWLSYGKAGEGRETGWKRKGIAERLKSLDVPTIEFPTTSARLGQPVQVDRQVYSPGTYTTPKFGSYNSKKTRLRKEGGGENSVFSPELVAVFENCVQQLQAEEDSILSHMDVCLPGHDEMEKEVEEPSNTEN